VPTNTEHIQT